MPRPRRRISVVIDERTVPAREGDTVLQAATAAGITIPTLCHLEGLSTVGSCRLCLVEIAEQPGLRPACATAATADMVVRTDTARLRDHRRAVMEMLLAEGNHVCCVCVANEHCELQDLARSLGVDHVPMRFQAPRRQVDASHPRYVFDPNRCVLCTRCVRTCDEIEGAHVWDVGHRGERTVVITGTGGPWADSTLCTRCGKCVAVCPTGALSGRHETVGETRHDHGLIARLVTARREHEWVLPAAAQATNGNGSRPGSVADEPRPPSANGAGNPATTTVAAPAAEPVVPATTPVPGPDPADGARRLRLATAWLGGCAGCHMSLLDLDEALLPLARRVDVVYGPLVDAKEFPPDVDVVLVEGAIANEENLHLARTLRARSRLVVALGDCAVAGNMTALRNQLGPPSDVVRRVYAEAVARDGTVPVEHVPALLPRVLPLHQVVAVDAYLPGCPPPATAIAQAITAALDALSPVPADQVGHHV